MKKSIMTIICAALASTSLAYYQAEEGRWMSRDPSAEKGGKNLYAFNYNNPVMYVDHTGKAPQLWSINPDGSGNYSPDIDWGEWDPMWGGKGNLGLGDGLGTDFSLSGYCVFGGALEFDSGTCCQNKKKYKWKTAKACTGMGIGGGIKGVPSIVSAVGVDSTSTGGDCPPSGSVVSVGTGGNLGGFNVGGEANIFDIPDNGPAGLSDGSGNQGYWMSDISLSATWKIVEICTTTRTEFEEIGCCDE